MPSVLAVARGQSSGGTGVLAALSTDPTGHKVFAQIISSRSPARPITGISGLGGTWTEVYNSGDNRHVVYVSTDATTTGNVTVSFLGQAATLGVFLVSGLSSTSIAGVQGGSSSAMSAASPSQTADNGQIVLAGASGTNNPINWPSSQTPSGWTSPANGTTSGIAYRVPGSSASHTISAAQSANNPIFVGQVVLGDAAASVVDVALAGQVGPVVAAVTAATLADVALAGQVGPVVAAVNASALTDMALAGQVAPVTADVEVAAVPDLVDVAIAGQLEPVTAAVEAAVVVDIDVTGQVAPVTTAVAVELAVPPGGVPLDLSTFVDLYATTSWDGTTLIGDGSLDATFTQYVLDLAGAGYTFEVDYEHDGSETDGVFGVAAIPTPDAAGADAAFFALAEVGGLTGTDTGTLTVGPGVGDWAAAMTAGAAYLYFYGLRVSVTAIRVDPTLETPAPPEPDVSTDDANDAYALTLGGWAVAEWEPAIVLAPIDDVRHAVISAIAYGPVTMQGTQPVFTYSEADAPRLRQRILLGGRDVTYDRDVNTPDVEYQLADLLLYGPGTLELPQYVAFAETGTDAADLWAEARRVKVQLVDDLTDPESPTIEGTIYKGFVLDPRVSGRHLSVELGGEASGRLNLRDAKVLFRDALDISRLIWRELTDVGVRYLPRLGEPGIGINSLNFGGTGKLEKVEELIARAVKKDGTQRAVMPDADGVYRISDKDTETVHFSVFVDDAFTVPDLGSDLAEKPNTIYATAIAPSGRRIDGASVPGLITTPAPDYPMDDNSNFGIGTTNEDTDSGDGVSVIVNRLGAVGLLDIRDTPGGFDEDVTDALAALQRKARLTGPVGVMAPALWRALWDLDVTGRSPRWSTIQPTAQDPSVQRYKRAASGAVIGLNPDYDPDAVQVDESIDMGTGFRERQVQNWSETRVHAPGAKVWYGTITVHLGAVLAGQVDVGDTITSADLIDARLVRPGVHNLWVPNFDGGTLFGVSGVQVDADSVTFTVDTRHRPAREVWERISVRRETRNDPARRWLGTRQSTQSKDAIRGFIGWGGIIDRDVPLERGWNVIEVVAGDYGTIARIRTLVQTVTAEGGVISIDSREYALAVFGKPVTAARLNELIPNPLTISGTKAWQTKKPQLDKLGLLYSVGTHAEPCGYAPGRKRYESETGEEPNPAYAPDADANETGTDDDETITVTTTESFGTVTGLHVDEAGFPYVADNGMTLFLAVRVSRPTTLLRGRVMWPLLEGGV